MNRRLRNYEYFNKLTKKQIKINRDDFISIIIMNYKSRYYCTYFIIIKLFENTI